MSSGILDSESDCTSTASHMSRCSAVSGIPALDNLKIAKASIIDQRQVNHFHKKEEEMKFRKEIVELQSKAQTMLREIERLKHIEIPNLERRLEQRTYSMYSQPNRVVLKQLDS